MEIHNASKKYNLIRTSLIIGGCILTAVLAFFSTENCDVTMDKGSAMSIRTQAPDNKTPSENSTLPVISITMSGKVQDDYTDAQMSITDDAGNTSEDNLYQGGISIKLRGNSTRYRAKQPYKIKLQDKADLFGMGANKHWVLLANDIDHTLIRNKLTLDFASDIGMQYTSESVLVSLTINGNYMGVYQLCEQIRVDEERVDIYDWKDTFGDTDALAAAEIETDEPQTGGFLLEADFYAFSDDTLSRLITNFKQPFYFNTPEYVSPDTELYHYANTYLQSFEYALHSPNYIYHSTDTHYTGSGRYYDWDDEMWYSVLMTTTYTDSTYDNYHYSQLFDLDSLVQNFLVCEMTMNWDCMKNSVFIYKDIDGLAYMGPVWDFDWAYGNINMYNIFTNIPEGFQTTNQYFTNEQYYQSVQWNRYLIRDPYFVLKVYEKYKEIRETAIQKLIDSIDAYENYLNFDGEANDEKWKLTYTRQLYGGTKSETFHDAMESLRTFVNTRVAWLDEQFTDFDTILTSLGAYTPSSKMEITNVTQEEDTLTVTATTTLSDASVMEFQINGVNVLTAPIENGAAVLTTDTSILAEGADLIQIRVISTDGEYIYGSQTPDILPLSNYCLYE